MKRYHIADALTAIELIMAIILTIGIVVKMSANWILWVFVAGELCDAFDGICARRWPYPDDGKYRWWRIPRTVQFLEHLSDIWLVGGCGIYLARCAPAPINHIVLACGLNIVVYCACIEAQIRLDPLYRNNEILRKGSILRRRKFYLAGITIGIISLVLSTSWSNTAKIILLVIGVIIGIILAKKKTNRLHDV